MSTITKSDLIARIEAETGLPTKTAEKAKLKQTDTIDSEIEKAAIAGNDKLYCELVKKKSIKLAKKQAKCTKIFIEEKFTPLK